MPVAAVNKPPAPPPAPSPAPRYGRIIPKEELGEQVRVWKPEGFTGLRAARPPISAPAPPQPKAPPPPPPPDPREILAAVRQQGYQDGLRDGLASSEAFKQTHARQVAAQIGALVAGFDAAFADLEARLADTLTEAAVALARQVVREELRQHPEHIARVAQEAVESLMLSARHVRIRLHPDDVPLVEAGAADVLRARGASLIADPGVSRGGCAVESDIASVSALIEQRWQLTAAQLGQRGLDWQSAAADPEPGP